MRLRPGRATAYNESYEESDRAQSLLEQYAVLEQQGLSEKGLAEAAEGIAEQAIASVKGQEMLQEQEQSLEDASVNSAAEELDRALSQQQEPAQEPQLDISDWTGSYSGLSEQAAYRNATKEVLSWNARQTIIKGLSEKDSSQIESGLNLAEMEAGNHARNYAGNAAAESAAQLDSNNSLAVLNGVASAIALSRNPETRTLYERALTESARYLTEKDLLKLEDIRKEQVKELSQNAPQRALEDLWESQICKADSRNLKGVASYSLAQAVEESGNKWMAEESQELIRSLADGTIAAAHALEDEAERLEEREQWLDELNQAEQEGRLDRWADDKREQIREELDWNRGQLGFRFEQELLLEQAYEKVIQAAALPEGQARVELTDEAASAYALGRGETLDGMKRRGITAMEMSGLNPFRSQETRLSG